LLVEGGKNRECEGDKCEHGVQNKEGGGDNEHVREEVRLSKVKMREGGVEGDEGTSASWREIGVEGLRQRYGAKQFVAVTR